MNDAHVILWTAGCFAGFGAALAVLRVRGALAAHSVAAVAWAWFGLMLGGVWQARLEILPIWEALAIGPADVLSGGGRLPLGLATGAALAGAWCAISGAPWRAVGDALAVAAAVMIVIGRFGCLAVGCCSGGVCGRWALPSLCLHEGRLSEVFARQFAAGLVDASSAAALPTHPLPVYFMVAAAGLLALLLWQLRRGAPAGSLLVTFGLLWPLAKLALEQLREVPRPAGPMVTVLAAMFAASAVIVMIESRGRSSPRH